MQCQGDEPEQPVALAYRNRQRNAAGTRRHLSNNNNKLLRKEGRGTRSFPFLPLAAPSTAPDLGLREQLSYLHLDKSVSPTFIHSLLENSAQIAQR